MRPLVDCIEAEETYRNMNVSERDFCGQSADLVTLSRGRLVRVGLARTTLPGLSMEGMVLEGCDLANARWEESRFVKVQARECRMTGIGLFSSRGTECLFDSCEVSFGDFRSSVFRKCRFMNCNLRGADFQGADLRETLFENCNLCEAQFSFTRLEGTDLRGSRIDGLRVGMDNLRGAIVDPFQAARLAGLMGLRVIP